MFGDVWAAPKRRRGGGHFLFFSKANFEDFKNGSVLNVLTADDQK